MSKIAIGILCIVILFVLLALRMWVGLAMTTAGFVGLLMMRGFSLPLIYMTLEHICLM